LKAHLILSSHLILGLPSGFFPSRFPIKTLYAPSFPSRVLHDPPISLTRYLLTWRIWWAPNNANKGLMGFNSAFKGLILVWQTSSALNHKEQLCANDGDSRYYSEKNTTAVHAAHKQVFLFNGIKGTFI
jgi:hypothetical protein